MNYLGLVVSNRPFDIYTKPSNLTEYSLPNYQVSIDKKYESRSLTIKPVKPKFHRCNETYQYGDLDYGAKCSCKVSGNQSHKSEFNCNIFFQINLKGMPRFVSSLRRVQSSETEARL